MQTSARSLKGWKPAPWIGLGLGIFILGLWITSLILFLSIPISIASWLYIFGAVILRTYLHTGLFIVAHDAMHGHLLPHHANANELVGWIAVTVYGFLPYDHCRENHGKHHRYTSQADDPDFCDSSSNPLFWYCNFIGEYFPKRSLITFLICMSLSIICLLFLWKVAIMNLVLFWLLPLILSSLQLFFFGTYLPHRQIEDNPNFLPRVERDRYSLIWSLISCYNFGHYHWEHHQYPNLPWYELPNAQVHSRSTCSKTL
jgi:beta-carotene ketolase (CrtW type)